MGLLVATIKLKGQNVMVDDGMIPKLSSSIFFFICDFWAFDYKFPKQFVFIP
jgi:hypothetical protein